MESATTKAYLIYIAGQTAGESYLLIDATRTELMGVPCVKGTYRHPTSPSHWLSGRTLHVPLDKVQMFAEYESADAYVQSVRAYYEAKSKSV